jgi:hypothetical protein
MDTTVAKCTVNSSISMVIGEWGEVMQAIESKR